MALLTAAASSAQTARLALRWKEVPSAQQYDLQISATIDFLAPEVEQTLTTTVYRWEKLPTVPYYWRVRGIDSEGRKGVWSAPQLISPPAQSPLLLKPEPGAVLTLREAPLSIELRFSPSPVLKQYLVELSADARFSSEVMRQTVVGPTASFSLQRSGAYFWRVSATDLEGRKIPPGPVRSFSLRRATSPPLVAAAVTPGERAPSEPSAWVAVPPTLSATTPEASAVTSTPPAPLSAREPDALAPVFSLKAQLGYCTSLGALSSPCGALEFAARPPRLPPSLSLALRLGLHAGGRPITLPGQTEEIASRVWVLPISVLVRAQRKLVERIEGGVGLGPTLIASGVILGAKAETRLLPGVQGLIGLCRPLGSGRACLEGGYLLGTFEGELARYRAGGLSLMIGYGVPL